MQANRSGSEVECKFQLGTALVRHRRWGGVWVLVEPEVSQHGRDGVRVVDFGHNAKLAFALRAGHDIGCRDEFTYALRLQEHWSRGSGLPHERRIRGSIYIGFNSVYGTGFSNVHEANAGGSWHDGDFASTLYGCDYHLELPENQPPGSPVFVVTALSRFLGL